MAPLTTDATDERAAQEGERTAAAARLPYLPGPDGLRAVALLAALADGAHVVWPSRAAGA